MIAPHALAIPVDTPPTPAVELRPLAWDTEFFGARMGVIIRRAGEPAPDTKPVARASLIANDLKAVLDEARLAGFAHVIFRAGADDTAAIWGAEQVGMRMVDVGVDSTIDFTRTTAAPAPVTAHVRLANEHDLPALQDLAAEAFVLSRFSADPFFTHQQVIAFHRQWMANLLHGLADAVLVHQVDGEIAGFISCSLSGDEGRIPLIATHAAFRRQGIGRNLVAASLRWFSEARARLARVKTQAHNYQALALYHGAGFAVSQTELTFSTAPSPLIRPGPHETGAATERGDGK